MRFYKAWTVLIVAVVTDCHPNNDRELYQNQANTDDVPRVNQINGNDAKENSNTLNPMGQHSLLSHKKAPMVDDDLLEFLVRVADNPAEWNKIQRVLVMLGRGETGAPTTTTTTTSRGPLQRPPASWPSSQWIRKLADRVTADAVARGVRAGGVAGPDPYDYDDDDDDEIEEIDVPAATARPVPDAGRMSRYQFRRIDGRPDDGPVNGTYVAVVESGDPARQKRPKSSK